MYEKVEITMFFVPIIPPENGKPTKKSLAVIIVITGTLLAVGAVLCLSFFFVDDLPLSLLPLILVILVTFGMIVVLALSVFPEDKTEGVPFQKPIQPRTQYQEKRLKSRFTWSEDDSQGIIRFCSSCGSELDQYDRFCATCGWRIS